MQRNIVFFWRCFRKNVIAIVVVVTSNVVVFDYIVILFIRNRNRIQQVASNRNRLYL